MGFSFDIIRSVKKSLLSTTFYALVGVFLVIMCMFFVPPVTEFIQGPIFLLPFIVFSLLGAALLFLTAKSKTKGKYRKLLILTGVSAVGFFISILLHNLLYALAIVSSHIIILKYLFEFLHATFFIIGVIVCPLGFAIGAISTIVILIKKRK
jgi:hypothetical protein